MTERPQFVRLFDNPNVFRSPSFQAFWKENSHSGARLGITFKGRLSSVWRMRIKRVIREWFRTVKQDLGSNDVNIVIRVPTDLNMSFVDRLKKNLSAWKRP